MKLVTIIAALIFEGCNQKIDSSDLKKTFLADPNLRDTCESMSDLYGEGYDIAMSQMRNKPEFKYLTSEAIRDFNKIFKEACREILRSPLASGGSDDTKKIVIPIPNEPLRAEIPQEIVTDKVDHTNDVPNDFLEVIDRHGDDVQRSDVILPKQVVEDVSGDENNINPSNRAVFLDVGTKPSVNDTAQVRMIRRLRDAYTNPGLQIDNEEYD